jgi:hypothetical protein
MDKVIFTRNYVWKTPGKICFVTFRINEKRQYKISIDVREKVAACKSDDIKDHKTRYDKITSGWIIYGNELQGMFKEIYANEKTMRFMSKIAFDCAEYMHVMPELSQSILFSRKYLEIPYPAFDDTNYDEVYVCSNSYEFWLSGDNQMNIIVTKLRSYYRTLTIASECIIFRSKDYPNGVTDCRDNFDEDYPADVLNEWILEEAINFYKPKICDQVSQIISVSGIANLIAEYVIS